MKPVFSGAFPDPISSALQLLSLLCSSSSGTLNSLQTLDNENGSYIQHSFYLFFFFCYQISARTIMKPQDSGFLFFCTRLKIHFLLKVCLHALPICIKYFTKIFIVRCSFSANEVIPKVPPTLENKLIRKKACTSFNYCGCTDSVMILQLLLRQHYNLQQCVSKTEHHSNYIIPPCSLIPNEIFTFFS